MCVLVVAVVIGCCSISISKLKCCHPASHLSFICSGPRLAANDDIVCHLPPAAPVSVSVSVSVSFSVTVSVVACPILSSASFLVSCWFWINLFCSQVNPQSQSQPLSQSPYPMRCISGPLRHKRRQQKKTRERERETERKWRKKPSRGTSHLPGAGRTSGFATTPSAAAREWYMKYLMVWH